MSDKKYLWWTLAGVGGAAALGAVLRGPIASQVERARSKIVGREHDIMGAVAKGIALLPKPVRYHVIDRAGVLLGQRDELTPPHWMFHDADRMDGSHNVREFITIGESTISWMIQCGLKPTDRVLDVGSGIGRMALPLTQHLTGRGSYDGIEIDPFKVRYCRRTVGWRHPNFRFHHADVFNKYYNPHGRLPAAEYRFPFADESFDFVFLVSVFTHMLPADLEHYVSEIARVMAKGATCIASFWLTEKKQGFWLTKEQGPPLHDYSEFCEIYRLEEPGHGVIYVESYVRDLYRGAGLAINDIN